MVQIKRSISKGAMIHGHLYKSKSH